MKQQEEAPARSLLAAALILALAGSSVGAALELGEQLLSQPSGALRSPRLPNINVYISRSEIKKLLGEFNSTFAHFARDWKAWAPAAAAAAADP